MKRFISLVLMFIIIVQLTPVAASASENKIFEYEYLDEKIVLTYSKASDVITENIQTLSNGQITHRYIRIIRSDGSASIYQDDIYIKDISVDYEAFNAVFSMNNTASPQYENGINPRSEIYQICGSTAYHNLVDSDQQVIDLINQNTLDGIMNAIIATYIGGKFPLLGTGYSLIVTCASRLSDCGARYLDLTQYKYTFTHTGGQFMNCYHCYFVLFNISSIGQRQVVDAYWDYYRVAI